jgi:hypothetical protein
LSAPSQCAIIECGNRAESREVFVMPKSKDLEQRVAVLERDLAELKRRVGLPEVKNDWIKTVTGSMKDYPEFKEVVRLGREYRRSQKRP